MNSQANQRDRDRQFARIAELRSRWPLDEAATRERNGTRLLSGIVRVHGGRFTGDRYLGVARRHRFVCAAGHSVQHELAAAK